MNKYKLIIFDFDGTIFATHEAIISCVSKTFENYNKEVPSRDAIFKTITTGIGLSETFKLLLNSNLMANETITIDQWVGTYRQFYNEEGETKSRPFDNVNSVFRDIKSFGKTIVVISNKGIDAIHSALDKFNLKQYVSLIVGDTKGIKKKPDPMIFNEIIHPKFKEITPNEILIVGDTVADLLFAKNIGADSCWATYGYGSTDECMQLNPTYSIANFLEINNIMTGELTENFRLMR